MPSASPLSLLLALLALAPPAWSQGASPAGLRAELSRPALADSIVHPGFALFRPGAPPRLPAELTKPWLRDGRLEPGYFLVHFRSAVTSADERWLDELTGPVRRADGSELARWYVPDDAFVVWVDGARTLLALLRSTRTDWVGRHEPGYKLDPTIALDARGDEAVLLDVDLIPGHSSEQVSAELEAVGARVLERIERRGSLTHDVSFLVVEAEPRILAQLLRVEGIRTVARRGEVEPLSAVGLAGELDARWVTELEERAQTGRISGSLSGADERYGQVAHLLDLLALEHPELLTCIELEEPDDSASLDLPVKNALALGPTESELARTEERIRLRFEQSSDPRRTSRTPSAALERALWIHDARGTTRNVPLRGRHDTPREDQRWLVRDIPSADGFVSPLDPPAVHAFRSAGEPLDVTLVWTDEPGSPGAGKTLIDDLDLVVIAPDGTTYRGRGFDGETSESSPGGAGDARGTVECVHIAEPAGGAWTVAVQPIRGAFSVRQGYALVVTGLADAGSREHLTVPTTLRLGITAGLYSKDGTLGAADLDRLRASDDDRFTLRDREQLTLAFERSVPAGAVVSAVRVFCEHQEQAGVSPGDILWKLGQGSLAGPAIVETTGAPLRGGDTLDLWAPVELASDPNALVVVIQNANQNDDTVLDQVYVELDYVLPVFAPHITSIASTTAVAGASYAYDADARAEANGSAPIAWSVVSAPDGFTIGASSGVVSWIPDSAGSIPITIQAANSEGTESQTFTVEVLPLPRTVLPNNALPIDYCPPERLALGPAAPQQRLNVFLPRGEPPPFGWPVVLNNRAGGGIAALPLAALLDTGKTAPLRAFLVSGVAVVDFGVTGIGSGAGLFYPPEDPSGRYESFLPADDNPEKEAEWAIQWLKTQAAFPLNAHEVCLRGSSHGAILSIWAAMGPERARASGSAQLRASTRVKAVLALQPPTSVWAFDQTPALAARMVAHFEQAALPGVAATAFGQVAERLQKDASVMGFAFASAVARAHNATQPICLLYGEPAKLIGGVPADLSLDAAGFPNLHDTLGQPFIHDSWAGYVFYKRLLDLSPDAAAFHAAHSIFGVRDTSALAPPFDYHTVTYTGGVFGAQAYTIAHAWVLETLDVVSSPVPPRQQR